MVSCEEIDKHIGERYGRLVIEECVGRNKFNRRLYRCRCDCGNIRINDICDLTGGNTKSCGCLHNELLSQRVKKHGKTHTRLYKIWNRMRVRCNNPNIRDFKYYGGRGIKVCEKWNDFIEFEKWANANGYKDDLTIERIDVDKDYEPDNCKWIPHVEQIHNRRNTIYVEYKGVKKPLAIWAKELNIAYSCLKYRYDEGWTNDEVIEGRNKSGFN